MSNRSNVEGGGIFSGTWPLLCFIFGSLCIPIALPWIIFQAVYKIQLKKQKADLQGKVVVITGASSGLGEALAHSFYKIGCQVVLAARRKDELERVKSELMQSYSTVTTLPPMVLQLDLSDLKNISSKMNYVLDVFKHVDILINNGGMSYRGDIVTTDIDVDIKVMLVNYFGTVALTKAILPSMISRKRGHIVCVSSVQGKLAIPYRSAYAASKHAMQAFSDSLRAETSKEGIDVTVVSPGYIKTDLSVNAVTGSGAKYGVMDATTAAGYEPSTVAEIILNAVANKKKDVIISSLAPQFGILIRTLFPSLYFWIMKHKAKNNTQS